MHATRHGIIHGPGAPPQCPHQALHVTPSPIHRRRANHRRPRTSDKCTRETRAVGGQLSTHCPSYADFGATGIHAHVPGIKPANRRSGARAHARGPHPHQPARAAHHLPRHQGTRFRQHQKVLTIATQSASPRRHATGMLGDIADTDADTTTDDYSYEAVSLRFKEAREASTSLKSPLALARSRYYSTPQEGHRARCPRRHPLFRRQLFPRRQLSSGQCPAGSARACIGQHRSSPTHNLPHDDDLIEEDLP